MRLYLASGFIYQRFYEEEKKLHAYGVRERLFNYYDINLRYTDTFNKVVEDKLYHLMIDSGAFSAATRRVKIDIEEYGKFLLKFKDNPLVDVMVNLDVIPYQGIPPPEVAAQQGWENLKYLESLGLKIMHVLHYTESEKWLTKLMDDTDYFGLSMDPSLRKSVNGYGWFDNIWAKVTDKNGKPIRKLHGFGMTSLDLIRRYPWFSVDSSTWGITGVYGRIMYPVFSNGKLKKVKVLGVSPESLDQRVRHAHYHNLSSEEKDKIKEWIESCGVSMEDILSEGIGSKLRDKCNVQTWLLIQKVVSKEWESRSYEKSTFQKGFFK